MGQVRSYLESKGIEFVRDCHYEWRSPCSRCGGDRFLVNDESEKFWCKDCSLKGQTAYYLRKLLDDAAINLSNGNYESGGAAIDYDHSEMVHHYTDGGMLGYKACRYRTAEGKKTFETHTLHVWGLNGQEAILYKEIRGP